ncbi:MAG TPA: TIR domain-containing protein [Ktedonobacteraceae bacterium]|jgi:hypothetical protein
MEHDVSEIFCVCASEDQKYLDQLLIHLLPLQEQYPVRLWERAQILPGAQWETEFNAHLSAAGIRLFLISPALLRSAFYFQALSRALAGPDCVLPVLLHPTSLQGTPLAHVRYLPRNGRAVVQQRNRDEAFVEITDEIKRQIWTTAPALCAPRPALAMSGPPPGAAQAFDFIAVLVEPKLAQFYARAQRHRRAWERSLLSTASSTGVTCLLALVALLAQGPGLPQFWQALLAWLLFLAASVSLVCVLLLLFSRLYAFQRWQYYQQRRAELQTEKRMYETRRGIYALLSDPRPILIERVFQIIQHAEEGTRSADETEDYLSLRG